MSVEHRLGFGSTIPVSFRKNNWYANLNPPLFLSGFKNFHVHKYPHSNRIYPSTRIRIHSSTQDSTGNIGNRACVVKRPNFASYLTLRESGNKLAILNTVFKVKTWLDLVTSPDEKIFIYPDLANTRFRIHTAFKNFHSGERISIPDASDTCGPRPYPERKRCGFKNTRIRVDVALVTSN